MSQKHICYIIIIYSLLNSVLKLQASELPWSAHTRLFHPTKFISVCLSEKEPQQSQRRPDLRGEKAGVGEKKRGKKQKGGKKEIDLSTGKLMNGK